MGNSSSTGILHAHAEHGNIEQLFSELNKNPGIIHDKKNSSTALHVACKNGQRAAASLLIDKGANINERDREGDMISMLITREAGELCVHTQGLRRCISLLRNITQQLLSYLFKREQMLPSAQAR